MFGNYKLWIYRLGENIIYPDQLASDEASRSGSTLFTREGIKFKKNRFFSHYMI